MAQLQPVLVVTNDRTLGRRCRVPPGRSYVGRQAGLGVAIDDATVSSRHAQLDNWHGQVTIGDLGSTNGTWVNGSRLTHTVQLHDGDRIRVGDVSLQFTHAPGDGRAWLDPGAHTSGSANFGTVTGGVQTGSGVQHNAGRDQYNAGRDIHHHRITHLTGDYDPWDELFLGRGAGRILMALGVVLMLVGFGLWWYAFFSGVTVGVSPFDRELIGGVPIPVAGFAGFAGGGILAAIGSVMSKAARKRQERQRQQKPPHV